MDEARQPLGARVEADLWPLVETFVGSNDVAGLAVGVVRGAEVVSRGFGVRDVGSRAPVTPETVFHLASVSKPFVATVIVSLATGRAAGGAELDLDAPITDRVPEFRLADGREGDITARQLLSHSSGLPDVSDYGWHDPQLGDEALSDFARSLAHWKLKSEPGTAHSYSNAGFDLLGLVLSRVIGTSSEAAVQQQLLAPLGMRHSTFLRSEVPAHLAASPHVGMPLTRPDGAYPYTRRHAPSSTLHSNLVDLCRWMQALLHPSEKGARGSDGPSAHLDAGLLELMWTPVVPVGQPPGEDAAALGWSVGTYRGQRTLSHSGLDPGFGSRLVLMPDERIGVVVLANSTTVPASPIAKAALDIALHEDRHEDRHQADAGVTQLSALLPFVVGPVAELLNYSGPDARSGGLPPARGGRSGRVRPGRRGVCRCRLGSDRAAPHRPGLATAATVDVVAPGLIDRVDDDRVGPSGRQRRGPGQEFSSTGLGSRPRQRRGRALPEQPPRHDQVRCHAAPRSTWSSR